ncbi:hypothetical protein ACJKIH_14780 [Brucella pseudogrignonensis]
MLAYYAEVVAAISTTLVVMISAGTLGTMMLKGFKFIVNLPSDIRNYFFKPKYILLPTPEEIAKFSQKQSVHYIVSQNEMREERSFLINKIMSRRHSRVAIRIKMYMAVFSTIYLIIAIKLIYYGMLSSQNH